MISGKRPNDVKQQIRLRPQNFRYRCQFYFMVIELEPLEWEKN